MRRTLILTSPTIKGALVTQTQTLLFNQGFSPGKIDGDYGPATAAAVRRAKWAFGYPEDLINTQAGDKLRSFLRDVDTLPKDFQKRALARQEAAKKLGPLVLTLAKGYLGYKESPAGSNQTLFGKWYGADGWPWCAMFVSYCLSKSGFKYVSPRNARWAYCPYVVADARAGRNGLKVIAWPSVSHALAQGKVVLALFDWDDDKVADHIGFVESVLPGGGQFLTIEGNTSLGNNSNGGEVMRRTRSISDVQVFVVLG